MNHRCPKRVITLINKIRAEADGQAQRPRSNAQEGTVRLFLSPEAVPSKSALEASAAARMAELTGDEAWLPGRDGVKTLALEHLMSARRFGFERFFGPLYRYEPMRTGLLGGNGSGLGFSPASYCHWPTHWWLATALRLHQRSAGAHRCSIVRGWQRPVNSSRRNWRAKAACDGLRALLVAAEPPSLRAPSACRGDQSLRHSRCTTAVRPGCACRWCRRRR